MGDEGKLRADFQQFYGLNIDDMGRAYTLHHAAALALELPPESRIASKATNGVRWGAQEALLANVEFWTHCLAYANTDDARHGRNKPRRFDPLGRADAKTEVIGSAVTREELERTFGH